MNMFNLSNECEVKCHQTFLCSGIASVINNWVQDGCVEIPEDITSTICKIMRKQILFP